MRGASEVSLVQAAPADAELIFSFMQQLRCDDHVAAHATPGDMLQAVAELISTSSLGRIWIIREKNQSVGYASLHFFHSLEFAGRCALLDEFFVAKEYRGIGIGKAALCWICQTAVVQLSIKAIFLEMTAGNAAAEALYRSVGFGKRPYHLFFRRTNSE